MSTAGCGRAEAGANAGAPVERALVPAVVGYREAPPPAERRPPDLGVDDEGASEFEPDTVELEVWSDDADAGVEYRARVLPGAEERILITRSRRGAAPSCTHVVLVHPIELEQWVLLPDGWGIEHAWRTRGDLSCAVDPSALGGEPAATGGDGSISWPRRAGVYPCQLDVEVVLRFPATASEAAGSVSLRANKLRVAGCVER
ncbi:MAG: hypothetical protein R3A51_16590 [Nannocystaceae bacterium]